jgi:hypothetical protein
MLHLTSALCHCRYEANVSSSFSSPVTIDLSATFFGPLGVHSAQEYSLSANQPVNDTPRYTWKTIETPASQATDFDLPRKTHITAHLRLNQSAHVCSCLVLQRRLRAR